jgi:hypothetical protein
MKAQLQMLAPGTYQVRLMTEAGKELSALPVATVERGHFTEVKFDLPTHQLCVLKIVPSGK